ncbi:hypothetical protein DFJ73DRAFT_802114 [Zopfochytrium polystomum]|nr:hypothetical protein DFJ73DRAFT_802114 [Zopfochytrium polystomum]
MSRLVHYAFDALLVSVSFAGIRRAGGFGNRRRGNRPGSDLSIWLADHSETPAADPRFSVNVSLPPPMGPNTEFDDKKIENETARNVVNKYFGVGDWVVDYAVMSMLKYPDYFVRPRGGGGSK